MNLRQDHKNQPPRLSCGSDSHAGEMATSKLANMTDKQDHAQEFVIRLADINDKYEIDLLSFFKSIWRWKWFIMLFTIITTSVAVYATFFVMPEVYTSNAIIEPIASWKNDQKYPVIVADFIPSLSPSVSKYQTMTNYLNSRRIKVWLIEKYNLLPRIYSKLWDKEKNEWIAEKNTDIPTIIKTLQTNKICNIFTISHNEEAELIDIAFVDKDPEFACRVVAGVIEELDRYLKEDHVTDAKRHRIFIGKQVARAKTELELWEKQRPGEKYDNEEIIRETQTALAVYTELRKQFELAKIDEDKQLVAFKILDPPIVPQIRSSPKRTLICAITLIASGFLATLMVFLFDLILKHN